MKMALEQHTKYSKYISTAILQNLDKRGFKDFYPPQWQALKPGLKGKNLIISIPTASGKTLIAEIIALQQLLKNHQQYPKQKSKRGKILYLCPLRALANEKFAEFRKNWRSFGFKVGLSTSDIDKPDFKVFRNDMIILTNEKADSILRLNPKLIDQLDLIICDEIHLLNDESRGVTLEFLLTLVQTLKPEIQIIGLSATIQNAHELASWINGELIQSDWRPVELKEGYYLKEEIHFQDGSSRRVLAIPNLDHTQLLVVDMIKEDGQVLVFANSRRSAMSTAEKLPPILKQIASSEEKKIFSAIQKEYQTSIQDDTALSKKLGQLLDGGVAFHHAGLATSHLNYIVEKFNQHQIRVICCTPTLAAGVNTPARRVIIKTLYRYSSEKGSHLIPIIEYKQMAGRAGRPRYDPYGEVIILDQKPERLVENALTYIKGNPEAITSKLAEEKALESHILGIIAAKIAINQNELSDFLTKTFYFYQLMHGTAVNQEKQNFIRLRVNSRNFVKKHTQLSQRRKHHGKGNDPLGMFDERENVFQTADELLKTQVKDVNNLLTPNDSKEKPKDKQQFNEKKAIISRQIKRIISNFSDHDLINLTEKGIKVTKFGRITTQTYLSPDDAILLREELAYATTLKNHNEIHLNALSWLHLITKLDACQKFYLRKRDYPMIFTFLEDNWEHFIMEEIWKPGDPNYPAFAQELKTAMILRDWINEKHDRSITEEFQIGPGDLYRLINLAQWILRAFKRIVALDAPQFSAEIEELSLRVNYGVKPSLIPLISLKGIGRMRARKIYQAGFTTLDKIKQSSSDILAKIPLIGESLAKSIIEQLTTEASQKRTNRSVKTSNKQNKYKLRKKPSNKKQSSLDNFVG